MPFNNDDADAPLVVDAGADWQPVFSVHTPLKEVLELAAIAADRSYTESLAILAADGVTMNRELREWFEAFNRTQTRLAFLTGYKRLKREAADEARDERTDAPPA